MQKYFAQFQQLKSLPPQVTKVKLQLALRPPHVKGVKWEEFGWWKCSLHMRHQTITSWPWVDHSPQVTSCHKIQKLWVGDDALSLIFEVISSPFITFLVLVQQYYFGLVQKYVAGSKHLRVDHLRLSRSGSSLHADHHVWRAQNESSLADEIPGTPFLNRFKAVTIFPGITQVSTVCVIATFW